MAEPMSAERFMDRWQNYRDQPQQVAAVRALYAAIAALEGGQQVLDEQAPPGLGSSARSRRRRQSHCPRRAAMAPSP